jgi:DNA-binding transcriptional regulator YiaG
MAIALNNHVFKGHRTLLGSKFVTYGELELPLRTDIYDKSKNGFDWGSSSKSANQLAFSILYQLSNKEVALEFAEQFTQDVVKFLNSRDWMMSASEVLAWIDENCKSFIEENEIEPIQKQSSDVKVSKKKIKKTNVVKEVCKELNITQKNLAEILEVPEGTISSWAVKNEIPRLGKKAIEFYIQNSKNQKIVDSYKSFINLLQAS